MPRRNRSTNKFPKSRRHTNTDGRRQIQNGKTRKEIKRLARILGIPYKIQPQKGN